MKKRIVVLALFTVTPMLTLQAAPSHPLAEQPPQDQAYATEWKQADMHRSGAVHSGEFVPGEILLRITDDVRVHARMLDGVATTSVPAVDELLQKVEVTQAEPLFPHAQPPAYKRRIPAFAGQEVEVPGLHNILRLRLAPETDLLVLLDELNRLEEVLYAEPNYVYSITGHPASDEITPEQLQQRQQATYSTGSVTPNDPLFGQQWHLPAVRVNEVWDITTGDPSAIIAILDTGVDWNHPDLAENIWVNQAEKDGVEGRDSDGNGFIDDIRGWDFINNNNDPMDDNGHGTHVAGIAAAVSDNDIGIAGVNWHARIMPIKVFQSSGRGDAATIAQGIWYAIENGATVLNMSFGSYARSQAMEDALAVAYGQAVLVAAAGNDGRCIGPPPPDGCAPLFPGALSFVLGVESTMQHPDPETGSYLSGFSNFDHDGPVYSEYADLLNYELRAPGSEILSTVPRGNYRVYNGTSMATPVVAGAVSLYQEVHPGESQELMWGNLINHTSAHLDIYAAITAEPSPELWFVAHTVVDTLDGDGDGRVDAGETIELWYTVRNTWGQADDVSLGIRFGEFEDRSTATILKKEATVGSVSPYALRTNEFDPLIIHFDPDLAHGRDVVFEAYMWNEGSTDTVYQRQVFTIENGTELSGVVSDTLVLTADQLWLINDSFRIGTEGKLIIKPGTKIINNVAIDNRGVVEAIGTPENMIEFSGTGYFTGTRPDWVTGEGGGEYMFEYTIFHDIVRHVHGSLFTEAKYAFSHCVLDNISLYFSRSVFDSGYMAVEETVIKNSSLGWASSSVFSHNSGEWTIVRRTTISNTKLSATTYKGNLNRFSVFEHNNIYNMSSVRPDETTHFLDIRGDLNQNHYNNNFVGFGREVLGDPAPVYALWSIGGDDKVDVPNQYWGTTDSLRIQQNSIHDFWNNPTTPLVQFWPYLARPAEEAHGIVWKVHVNGVDPQEEHVDPVGVGPARFDVYFSKPMDTDHTPVLTFGVREPYTQHMATDNASWSEDGRIFTVYHNMELRTGDGINRIRVSGARDLDGFEIPVENRRFEFLIDAAGAASAGFQAIAGLGKVDLEWEEPELDDFIGFNMYRFAELTDTTFTEPEMINAMLIDDPLYTDYEVEPGDRYYYYYKILRTNLEETDSSRVVSTVPLTSVPGDANGDFVVDVVDVVTMVAHILGQNPQPFIFEAADINQDGVVDVLDIVGTIQIILAEDEATSQFITASTQGEALIGYGDNVVHISSTEPLAGLQFTFTGWKDHYKWQPLPALGGFEISYEINEETLQILAYNLNGSTMPAGTSTLFHIEADSVFMEGAVLAGSSGQSVAPIYETGVREAVPEVMELDSNYPNPFNNQTTLRFRINEQVTGAEITIFDILGRRVQRMVLGELQPGYHERIWDAGRLASGVYIYRLQVEQHGSMQVVGTRKMLLLK